MTLEDSLARRSSRVRLRFDQAWVPRLGPEAAARLARLALLALLLGPVVIVLSVLAGLGISAGRPTDLALGVAAVLAVLGLCCGWIRLSSDFAAAVSTHFGEEIGWRELPRFRPSLFDEWATARGLRRASR
jgi:hypothetical protein